MPENLRVSCIPETMLDGKISTFDTFLGERHELMALKMKTYFPTL